MLNELSDELRKEVGVALLSPLKSYLQFQFEQKTIILEYTNFLWFSSKLLLVNEFILRQDNALFSLKESPNFYVFLKQIDAFKVEISEKEMIIKSIIPVQKKLNLSKNGFKKDLETWVSQNSQELRNSIKDSLHSIQQHYLSISNQANMLKDRSLRKALDNDMTFIFMEKGDLIIHGTEKLPFRKQEQKVYPNQKGSPLIELRQIEEKIFDQLEACEGLHLENIVNMINSHIYFTFYQQRFLVVSYTVLWRSFIEQQEGESQPIKVQRINESVQIKSALFSVNNESNKHILLNEQEDTDCVFPQIALLLSKQLQEIIEPNIFMNVFTQEIEHNNVDLHSDIQELSQRFQLGSVLIYKTNLFINKACVYLGCNLIITVVLQDELILEENISDDLRARIEKENEQNNRKIFKFQQLEEFNPQQNLINIKEIRFSFQPYDKQELLDKAVLMNDQTYEFNIYKQNSEHLAFLLASGFRFSPQQSRLVNKIGAAIQQLLGN